MLENILFQAFQWLTVTQPQIGIILMVLGGAFILLEAFIKATPSKADDETLARYMDGYIGKLFRAIQRFAPGAMQTLLKAINKKK